jgi:hypothetical protein
MTQEAIIQCLQNGSLNSYQIEDLTGIPRLHIVAACKHLFRKKKITVEKVKLGRSWVCKYTLEPHMVEVGKVEEPRCLLNPFDVRNAQGIFSKSEYAVMNAQARRLLNGNQDYKNAITNNQFI